MKFILFLIGIMLIGFLFLVHNAMSRPVYNKMSNVWEDDPKGRQFSQITIMAMLFIAFLLGSMF
jgi:hypothetical protein